MEITDTTITLDAGESLNVIIDGKAVKLTHVVDGDGHGVTLSGFDCDLEGDVPGAYWLAPAGTIAARYGG